LSPYLPDVTFGRDGPAAQKLQAIRLGRANLRMQASDASHETQHRMPMRCENGGPIADEFGAMFLLVGQFLSTSAATRDNDALLG